MKFLKKLPILFFVLISSFTLANEGMWLPLLLEKLNEKEMRSLGMKISARDIYNVNKGSLKDAIVSFGGFCTGEVISAQGLVLTNHHCGFDAVQRHSSLENNYIRDGFWAKNKNEELSNPGLFVTFIVRIEDITSIALNGVASSMAETERQSQIDKNLDGLRKITKREEFQHVLIRPFFEGNQYFLFVTETYNDVRLVGAPPSSIGNFGKDTDNWMWPRHTGDFSLFRIYAGKDNKPAAYSPDNIPYQPKKALSISLDGVSQDDFTMVFGFPGRTYQYLHSAAVKQIVENNNPVKISVRDKALAVIDGFMRNDEQIKIQYAAKWASISNAWKKWQGEILGLTRTGAIAKKKIQEQEFQTRVDANPAWKEKYGRLLNDLQSAYDDLKPYGLSRDYFLETVNRIELFTISAQLNSLVGAYENEGEAGYNKRLQQVKERLDGIYSNYNSLVDQKLFEVLMEIYVTEQEEKYKAGLVKEKLRSSQGNFVQLREAMYSETYFDDAGKTMTLLSRPVSVVVEEIKNNPAVQLFNDMIGSYQMNVQVTLNEIQDRINTLQRLYMAAQMEVFKEKVFYPDANSTMRLTYGTVGGYQPRDAVVYDHYTWLDGVVEKYKPGDYEFDIPDRLVELYKKKDYGRYGVNGKQPVCFIASNHTTGGNSGSPALNANGNLVGLNFDRVWEGTMSDIYYDPSICRNIMVDIRYILFIIDKFANAGHLVNEMTLVQSKSKK